MLFAVSGELIVYSAEVKQYESDVALALALTVLGLDAITRPDRDGPVLRFMAAGVVLVWFSHPSAFVIGGIGLTMIVKRFARCGWRGVIAPLLGSVCCLVSFAGVFLTSREQMGHHQFMWGFWQFAFPPLPTESIQAVAWPLFRIAFMFLAPLTFGGPFSWPVLGVPAMAAAVIGALMLGRREPDRFAVLAMPLLMTLLASYPRAYPFHGRLLLFLTPALLIFVAEGLARLRSMVPGPWAWKLLLASVLLPPMLETVGQFATPQLVSPRNAFGDRRPWRLDPNRFPWRSTGPLGIERPQEVSRSAMASRW